MAQATGGIYQQYNPNLVAQPYYGGYMYYAGGAGTTPSVTPDTQPAAVPTVGPDLSALYFAISTIPEVHDGQVITADHHNQLRLALQLIADQLGARPITAQSIVTLVPLFFKTGDQAQWQFNDGVATGAAGAKGYLPVQLPHGAQIDAMVVMGNMPSTAAPIQVTLLRMPLAAGKRNNEVIQIDRAASPSGTFTERGEVEADNLRIVNNLAFKYAIYAEATGSQGSAEIQAIQLTYT